MNKTSLLMASLCLSSTCVLAGSMGAAETWSSVATLSLGPVWAQKGSAQQFYLTPDIEKRYTVKNQSNTLIGGEFFYGRQHRINAQFVGQIGLAVAATSNTKISGMIWDDADPQFDNYTYSYKINHTHVAMKAKVLADTSYFVQPYVSGSIGVGFNHAHGYQNTPTIFEAVVNPNFASHTQTSFTYTVGAGLQKALSEHMSVGVGYEFSDWGKTQLDRAAGQTLGTGLSQSQLYTNGLLFNITYLS